MTRTQTARAQAPSRSAAATAGLVLQRKCACGQHTLGGECSGCRKKRSEGVVQPKLSVGAAEGPWEAQADQVADSVMAGRLAGPPRVIPLGANVPGFGVPDQISADVATLEGRGDPLPERERSWFEPRFGRSFGDVRVHSGSNAAGMASDLNARAFTFGRNIVFRPGEYAPGSEPGRRLLAHELTHVMQQGAPSSAGLVQRSWYSDLKEKAYSGLISAVRKGKNSSMNALRAMVPKLPPRAQNAALTMIWVVETSIEIVLSVVFAVLGMVVGFGEGIVDMVRGLVSLTYGVINLLYDLLKGIFVGFDDFKGDINALVDAITGLPGALTKLVKDWLDKFEKAGTERQSAMIGELTGQVLALIATYGVSVSKAGSAGRIAAGGAEAVEVTAATTAKAAGVAGEASQAARPALKLIQGGGQGASTAAKATAPVVEGSSALKVAPLIEEAPAVSPVRLVPPPVPAVEAAATTAAKGASTGAKVAVGTGVAAVAVAGKATKRKKEPKDPCEALPILWPDLLPRPGSKDLKRTSKGEREFEGIDGGTNQVALANCMRDARERKHPIDPAVYCEHLGSWFERGLENTPADAHHIQPRYLNGEDEVFNLAGIETNRHHAGHWSLDNQSSMLNTPEWMACAPINGSLRYHPLGQEYYVAGRK